MKRSNLQITLYLLAVFLSGAVGGALAYRLYTVRTVEAVVPSTPDGYRRKYFSEMKERLHLDDSQAAQLNRILDDTRAKTTEVKKKVKPFFTEIHEEQVRNIRTMLTESQKVEYGNYLAEREREQKAREAAAKKP